MKLRRIKLSGFKSFVDATTVELPSQLVGIVGPNGCGKSNVVDALRWVLGESSARQLRGDSMLDVIFNGSQARAPVSRAQVELRFDNSAGRALGPFAGYAEIAVKRELGRDGTSQYSINQTRCRRRDVADLFLGTGLGPRAYAIIEQGMISRIIEARPEDMRAFLEEASGVSRYKERRRETELRIEHTRENLARVTDLCQELESQLKRLERQAEAARRYRAFKAEERQLQAARLRRRLADLEAEMDGRRTDMAALRIQLEEATARLRSLEAQGLREREAFQQAQEQANDAQGRYYASAAELARLEQQLAHLAQEEQRLQSERDKLLREEAEVRRQAADLDQYLTEADKRLRDLEAKRAAARSEESTARDALHQAESELTAAERDINALEQEANGFRREVQVQGARLEQLRARLQDLHQRRQRLQAEAAAPAAVPDDGLRGECAALEAAVAAARDQEQALLARLGELRRNVEQADKAFDDSRERYQTRRAQWQALEQSVAAMSRPGEGLKRLAEQLGDQARMLLEQLQVEPGWEQAVETVLGWRLKALQVDDLEAALPRDWLGRQKNGQFALLEAGAGAVSMPTPDALLHKLHWQGSGANPLAGWLAGIRCAPDLDGALRARGTLQVGEFWITPDGVLLGRHSFEWDRGQAQDSLLRKREEVMHLADEVAALESAHEAERGAREALRQELTQLEQALNLARRELQERQQQLGRLQADLARREAEQAAHARRMQQVAEELQALDEQAATVEESLRAAEQARAVADSRLRNLDSQLKPAQEARSRAREHLQIQRSQFSRLRESLHQLELQMQGLQVESKAKQAAKTEAEQRLGQCLARLQQTEAAQAAGSAARPALEESLQACLRQRDELEAQLREARNHQESIEAQLRQVEEMRLQVTHEGERLRQQVQAAELHLSAGMAKAEELGQQLAALLPYVGPEEGEQVDVERMLEALTALSLDEIEARLEQLGRRIGALGNVNLAAIEEQQQVAERKGYLDAQYADLNDALETLEAAIRRMDKETRERFQQTFEAVNRNFQVLFPRLFGGGEARLALTEDNLLEAGVSVTARPPGKRNSSIHLLSGGEKSLTAVALVFALFQLNPAPFCVLDEVDAPLDEANVGRFCDMVREMSGETQFLFITHNKVTMQLADHLIGVTMAEPGVSRIVSVDVEEAARMAGVA
ncbi:MAG: chromosome segregation protein SMC [Pseudomonadota bacterium]